MDKRQRILVLAAALVAIVVGFVLLSPGDSDVATTPISPPPAATTGELPTTTTGELPATTTATAPRPARDPAVTIRVRSGKPVGGLRTIKVRRGERVRLRVTSADTSDEVHVHVYDIARDLKPGSAARFSFKADAEGIFEIELEGRGVQIAKLEVRPR